jgi:rsbT co-antagonist protein RsbR
MARIILRHFFKKGTESMQQAETMSGLIRTKRERILNEWVNYQLSSGTFRRDLLKESEVREQSAQFLAAFSEAMDRSDNPEDPAWKPVKDLLANLSRRRAIQGFTPGETALFVLSLKQPLFDALRQEQGHDHQTFIAELWAMTVLVDKLGLYTIEAYQQSREEVIARQQQELLELSTPVVKLWDNILALPLIGTLDSARTQVVMESLLERIVESGALIAIIDITGVPTVDTLVAQHLMKTVAAARLMGADCIISGIRPQIAQTIVHLGVNLNDIITKATLADAFLIALERTGQSLGKAHTNRGNG